MELEPPFHGFPFLPQRFRTAGPLASAFMPLPRRDVRYVVRWARVTEMVALSASAAAVIGYFIWG
jgi:hypothetical protein